MRFFRRKPEITDEEFIERLHRQMREVRKLAICLTGVLAIALGGLVYLGATFFRKVQSGMSEPATHGYWLGMLTGACVGFLFVVLLSLFIQNLFVAFGPGFFRLHRLLFKYHALVASLPKEQRDGSPSPGS